MEIITVSGELAVVDDVARDPSVYDGDFEVPEGGNAARDNVHRVGIEPVVGNIIEEIHAGYRDDDPMWIGRAAGRLYEWTEVRVRVEKRRFRLTEPEGDLLGMATFGLMGALANMDPSMAPAQTISYLQRRVRGSIVDSLRQRGVAHLIAGRAEMALSKEERRIQDAIDSSRSSGGSVSYEEAADALGLSGDSTSREKRRRAYAAVADPRIVGVTLQDGRETNPLLANREDEKPGPEAIVMDAIDAQLLRDAIAELPERQQAVIRHYYFEGSTLLAISELLGVTESRASQIKTEAIKRLRMLLREPFSGV